MAAQRWTLECTPEIRCFLLENVQPTGRTLGVGSYGSVEEVEVDGLICAGKKIHEVLMKYGGVETVASRYVAECQLLSDLRHPHIVQFLGLCFLEGSHLPVLVMEKLITSLDKLIKSTPNIPLGLKKSILADAARGVIYLHDHKPSPIIHRDLSTNNILLNSALVAKISDLGNSRIVDFQPGQLARTLSRAPGTMIYMSPEALDESARYGPSLDIFSFGHLSLITLAQLFPGEVRPHIYPDPLNRRRLIARSEVERREVYFTHLNQQLGERHPLMQLTKQCLDNDPEYRPSAVDVLQQLEAVEVEDPYQHMTKMDMIRLLQQRADPQREEEIKRLQTQLQHMQVDMADRLAEKDRVILEKERAIKEMEETIRSLQVRGLRKNTKLHFKHLRQLPTGMENAQAVMYKGALYVGGGSTAGDDSTLFMYQFKPDTWATTKTPTCFYALTVYLDHLVLAGGHLQSGIMPTDQIWLIDEQHTFKQTILPMNTPTHAATAINTEEHLIIAGGFDGRNHLTTIQLYNGKQWALAQPLPVPVSRIKYTFLNNNLYLIGGHGQGKKVFCTSLPVLLGSVHQLDTTHKSTPTVWNTHTDAPLAYSSSAILRSELVAIGGGDYLLATPSLHFYSRHTHRWEEMEATLPQPLHSSCSFTLPTGELMVIGGWGSSGPSAQVYSVSVDD